MPDPSDRIRTRAERLARHAAADTHEGHSARRELERMVARYPSLATWLDTHATETVERTIQTPTAAHRKVLNRLLETSALELDISFGEDGTPRFLVRGAAADLRTFNSLWDRHSEALDLAIEIIGDAWANMAFPASTPTGEDEDPAPTPEPEGAEQKPDPRLERWISDERDRVVRLFERAQRLPSIVRVRATFRRALAPLLEEQEGSATRALIGGAGPSRAWDDPTLSFPEFVTLFRATFPNSRRADPQLRVMFRDGQRVHPGTRELRTIRALRREDWNF